MKKLPVGIENFSELVKNDFLYVDKTKLIYELLHDYSVFIARPKGFGKTFLLSTLEEIFNANKEVFKQTFIYNSNLKWERYPVIKLNFSSLNSFNSIRLENEIIKIVAQVAEKYEIQKGSNFIDLGYLIRELKSKFEKRVVILIDEFDKPTILTENSNRRVLEMMETILRDIKNHEEYIQFVCITALERFKPLITLYDFDDYFIDITMYDEFSNLFGFTEEEIIHNFKKYINRKALEENKSSEEIIQKFKENCKEYDFTEDEAFEYYHYLDVEGMEQKTTFNDFIKKHTKVYKPTDVFSFFGFI